jgi:hypothetical protein
MLVHEVDLLAPPTVKGGRGRVDLEIRVHNVSRGSKWGELGIVWGIAQ